ncbi:MAG: hypothetical protein U0R69_00015 [Gaiellales bacterium]
MGTPLDAVVEEAVADAARKLAPGANGKFREKWIEVELVDAIAARLGPHAVTRVKKDGFPIPDWQPSPKSFDVRVLHPDGGLRAAIECKQQKVDETLWDVYKLVAAAQLSGFEGGYAAVAATEKTWASSGDCVALFGSPVGQACGWDSASLFEDWRRAWSDLLRGGSARPTRVPRRITVRALARCPLGADPSWELRAIRVDPVPGSGWLEFGRDGWPVEVSSAGRDETPGLELRGSDRPGGRSKGAAVRSPDSHGGQLRTTVARDWYWEGNVQALLASWLEAEGWTIEQTADTASRERGTDIRASRGEVRLGIEVKGYPSEVYARGPKAGRPKPTLPVSQARQWYSHALLSAAMMLGCGAFDQVALCFPDRPTYRNLIEKTRTALALMSVTVYLVREDGEVMCDKPVG